MDAIASQGLAIGLELCKYVLILVALLALIGLREGRGVELGFKIPSFSFNLRVLPREIPGMGAPPKGTGSTDDFALPRESRNELETDFDDHQQVASRELNSINGRDSEPRRADS
ncbi:MAG TPA: hypothetical protein VFT79_08785 [Solirubrobacterales bacterium]|nr:hypothetical protein [Solirubrobacterales bacterium]